MSLSHNISYISSAFERETYTQTAIKKKHMQILSIFYEWFVGGLLLHQRHCCVRFQTSKNIRYVNSFIFTTTTEYFVHCSKYKILNTPLNIEWSQRNFYGGFFSQVHVIKVFVEISFHYFHFRWFFYASSCFFLQRIKTLCNVLSLILII